MSKRCFLVAHPKDFLEPDFTHRALSTLTTRHTDTFDLGQTQRRAWEEELSILKGVAADHGDCSMAIEYMIPRMGKRADVVMVSKGIVFVLEFKVGESNYPQTAANQVADYAFDLKNFHLESHNLTIVPIAVCTEAPNHKNRITERHCRIFEVLLANKHNLSAVISQAIDTIGPQPDICFERWIDSTYSPTPTIIEAAQALYESHEVEEISRHEADITDINATTECIDAIIRHSREHSRKSICFVTGVPGAGKTMVGLNIAARRRKSRVTDDEEIAVFLSGNGPLIDVLQESLARDQVTRDQEACSLCDKKKSKANCAGCTHFRTKEEIRSEVKAFIQGVHLFREELFLTQTPPPENIAIFDESQRAWSREHLSKKMKTRWNNARDDVDKSEPECLIEYMDRLPNWATVICLVGGGQEIHDGEAGIVEWFNALHSKFPHWDVYASPEIKGDCYLKSDLFEELSDTVAFREDLHLGVDMRSFRNKRVAAFAEAVVDNEPDKAAALYESIFDTYPIYITRDLNDAKKWAREQTKRPSDRCGIIANSHGERIRADGILVPGVEFKAAKWFLDGRDEVDSSYFMEIAASEFKVQGLEIDYAVVAWEADYRYKGNSFSFHRFYGGKWQNVNNPTKRRYLTNGYRVLLTRARQGFVIYIPTGSEYDPTRPPEWYDGTYKYLKSIGIKELP